MPDHISSERDLDVTRRSLIATTAGIALAGCSETPSTTQSSSNNQNKKEETEKTADFPRAYAKHDRHGKLDIMLGYNNNKVLRDKFLVEVLAYNGLPTNIDSANTVSVFSYEFEGEPDKREHMYNTSSINPKTVNDLAPNVPVNIRVRIHNLTKDKTEELLDTAAIETLSYVKYTDPETGEPITADSPPEKSPVVERGTYHVRETVFTKVPLDHWPEEVNGSLRRSDEPYPATYPETLLSFTFPEEKIQYAKYLRDNDDIHVGGRNMVDFTYSTPDRFSQFGDTYVAAEDDMYADVTNQIEHLMDSIGVEEGNHFSRLQAALRLVAQNDYVGFENDDWRNGGVETSSVRLPAELWADGRGNCSDMANNLAWLLEQMGYRAGTISIWKNAKPYHLVTGVQLDVDEIRSGFPDKVADAILNTDNTKYQIARESDSGSIAPWVYMDPTVSKAYVGQTFSEGFLSVWDYRDPFRYDDRDIRGLELN